MVEFKISKEIIPYEKAIKSMEERVSGIISGDESELIWFLEHPPLYTGGTSAKKADLLDAKFPVYETGRGGEYTYHGPGQRVAYVMLDLKNRDSMDIKKYVWNLEEVIIRTVANFGITGERREGRVGIWVVPDMAASLGKRASLEPSEASSNHEFRKTSGGHLKESKIAAVGIRIKKWVTYHGIAININPELSHFSGIVPCGIKEFGVTSFEKLGKKVSMGEFDEELKQNFLEVF